METTEILTLPILNCNLTEGTGVIIKDLFITAAHVLEEAEHSYININGNYIVLLKENALLYANDNNATGYDIAVFRLPMAYNDFQIAEDRPLKGTILLGTYYRMTSNGMERSDYQATVVGDEGNYFIVSTNPILKPGSSGSPILKDKSIYGILHGGSEGLCAFLDLSNINKYLKFSLI